MNKTQLLKAYFRSEDSEYCYPLKYHLSEAAEEGLTEVILFQAEEVKVPGVIWCNELQATGEKGECGRDCPFYKPRNGKSGMCANQGRLYEPGDKFTFKVPERNFPVDIKQLNKQ